MNDVQHRDLAAGRWWTLSLAEQLGNIGSEISRALHARDHDVNRSHRAFVRALELFDLTLDDARHRRSPPRLRELARAREVVVDFFAGDNAYHSTGPSLQKYFDQFAVASSLGAERSRRVRAIAAGRQPPE